MTREAGKGSRQRPTNYQSFAEQMEIIFGKKTHGQDNQCLSSGLREDTHAAVPVLNQERVDASTDGQGQRSEVKSNA